MLKTLRPDTFAGIPNAKCGEVYFQSINSYRIDCAFCELKSFVFADFVLHIQNQHFENGLLKAEVLQPKQEMLDTSPMPATGVNAFSWYEVSHNDDLAGDSDNDFMEDTKHLQDDVFDEDPVGMSNNAITIMKWERDNNNETEAVRQTRAIKVDYNEDSDIENASDDIHQAAHQNRTKKESIYCTHCDKTFQSKRMMARHMERQHKSLNSDETNTDIDPEDIEDVDYQPPKIVTSKPASITEYKCEHCNKVYQGKYTLRQHIKRDHDVNISEAFICLECNEQLPRLRLLDEHMVKAHGGALCPVCDRRYKTRHELKRHQLKHTNERNVVCSHPGCGKRFYTTRHMRNHSKVHSEQKNFVCESCGYSCRNKETLRVHLRSHTGERPFGCKVCNKHFPSHSGLREHMAMHSTERPYVCNVCGATFSRQKGLYHHKFLHMATKQFVCKLCGNAYAQAAGLAGHMRKHRNDELNG